MSKSKNSALANLFAIAKNDGAVSKTENAKQNIYKSVFFEGVTDEKEEKKIRRTLRSLAINYLQLIAGAKDKKSFAENYAKFEKFFTETYANEKVDFSVFDGLRKESAQKILASAKANCEKFAK
jgi:hypothetical protein